MTTSRFATLGIDFGTSNSAMAWAMPGSTARLLPVEGTALAMPTAVFFSAEEQTTHFGRDALAHYLAGTEGRLLRSLKSLLGSPLLTEKTAVNHNLISFQDIIATFLAALRERAAQATGQAPERVVMGRPVHFVDDDPVRDALAEQSLREAAEAAGFSHISFQLEPIAAAMDYERRLTREARVLVVDIGGGTSDFTVVRLGPQRLSNTQRGGDVLATTGVHVGGTDFDRQLSLERAMPLLGYRHLGPQQREVPNRVFFDLSTWHLIQWQYSAQALSHTRQLRVNYTDVRLHERLVRVLEDRLGHRVAHEVEQAKIRCSGSNQATPIDLHEIEKGLSASLAPPDLHDHLASLLDRTVVCARDCVTQAGVADSELDAIYLTGGSSALRPFQQALSAEFAGVPLVEGDLFGGVASGLAYGAGH